MMNDHEEMIAQIKTLSASMTETTYHAGIRQGYALLMRLRDAGMERERVYRSLLQYHDQLEEGLSRDFIADILDFVAGWCSPQCRIWDA